MQAIKGNVTQITQGNGKTQKLGVRRPFVPLGPTIRLTATKNVVCPTTRLSTPSKRITPKKNI